jgi:hypothetical protein
MGRERMLSGAHASSRRHLSTWAHAILGGKVISLGFPWKGGQTPHACNQEEREPSHNHPFSSMGGPLHHRGKTDTPYYEANCFFL